MAGFVGEVARSAWPPASGNHACRHRWADNVAVAHGAVRGCCAGERVLHDVAVAWVGLCDCGVLKKESSSFLKKRTKKLLSVACSRGSYTGEFRGSVKTNKGFLLLFFKKELLP
jgi:hypothetical protein